MKRKDATKATAQSRGIIRDLYKENGLLKIYRGISAVHTSRAEKRRSRNGDRKKAIKDSED